MLNLDQISKDQLDKLYVEIKAEVDEAFLMLRLLLFPKEEAFQDLFPVLRIIMPLKTEAINNGCVRQ